MRPAGLTAYLSARLGCKRRGGTELPEPRTEFEVSEAFAGTFSSGWWRVPPQLASGQLASGAGRAAAVGAKPSVVLWDLVILFVAKICNSTQFSTRQRPCQPQFPENCFLISKVHPMTVPSCRRDRKSPYAPQFFFIEARLLHSRFTLCPARCGCRSGRPTRRRRQTLRPRRVWMVQRRLYSRVYGGTTKGIFKRYPVQGPSGS